MGGQNYGGNSQNISTSTHIARGISQTAGASGAMSGNNIGGMSASNMAAMGAYPISHTNRGMSCLYVHIAYTCTYRVNILFYIVINVCTDAAVPPQLPPYPSSGSSSYPPNPNTSGTSTAAVTGGTVAGSTGRVTDEIQRLLALRPDLHGTVRQILDSNDLSSAEKRQAMRSLMGQLKETS